MRAAKLKDFIILGATAALWGTVFPAIELAIRGLPPLSVAAGRLVIAALVLRVWAALRREHAPLPLRAARASALVGVIGFAIPFSLVAWAETLMESASAAILFATSPLIGAVISHVATDDDRIDRRKALGLVIGFSGAALVIGAGTAELAGVQWAARFAVVGSACCYAVAGQLVRRIEDATAASITTRALLWASCVVVPAAMAVDRPWLRPAAPMVVGAVVYLGVIPTALCYVVRFWQTRELGYSFVANAGYLVPCFATFWAVVLLGEPLRWHQMVGLVAIVLGVLVGHHRMKPPARPSKKNE